MSQLGSFFRKIIFLDSQRVDLAPQADSCEVSAFLPLDPEAGDNLHRAYHIIHGFFTPKLDWNLPNLGRMC